jgi:hypothetical protein
MALGGMGILDLKLFSSALRLRWLWLQRTKLNRVWSLLPVKKDPTTTAFFHASTLLVLGDGQSFKFWQDAWL